MEKEVHNLDIGFSDAAFVTSEGSVLIQPSLSSQLLLVIEIALLTDLSQGNGNSVDKMERAFDFQLLVMYLGVCINQLELKKKKKKAQTEWCKQYKFLFSQFLGGWKSDIKVPNRAGSS